MGSSCILIGEHGQDTTRICSTRKRQQPTNGGNFDSETIGPHAINLWRCKVDAANDRGAGIARPYITTYIRAPGMGKQDHPLPGVVYPRNFGSPSIRPRGRYICKSRTIDISWCRHSQTIYNHIYTGTRHG